MTDIDALGEKGEQRFGELCADAGLICNKAGRDRAGWDFVVNFGSPATGSLDSRQGALSCYVQVKTIMDSSRAAKLKLNMAERLAKEPKPSFIVIFKVNEAKAFTGAFLVHVAGNRLSAILKRLREEQRDDPAGALNKKSISFSPSSTEAIDLDGGSLKAALLHHIGTGLSVYIERKQADLEKLGFDERAYTVTTTFHGLTDSELVDAFIGLRDEVPNTVVQVTETRFDIAIDEPETLGAVRVISHPSESCLISYRASPLDMPVSFRGDVIKAPAVGTVWKMRIRCDLIDIVIERARGKHTLHYAFTPHGKRCTPSEWLDYWRFVAGVCSGKGGIELQFDSSVRPVQVTVRDQPVAVRERVLADAAHGKQIFEALVNLCRRAGVAADVAFSAEEVYAHWGAVIAFHLMTTSLRPDIRCEGDSEKTLLETRPTSIVAAGSVSLGEMRFAIYGIVRVEIDSLTSTVSLHDFNFRRLCAIRDDEAAFQAFINFAEETENVTASLIFGQAHP